MPCKLHHTLLLRNRNISPLANWETCSPFWIYERQHLLCSSQTGQKENTIEEHIPYNLLLVRDGTTEVQAFLSYYFLFSSFDTCLSFQGSCCLYPVCRQKQWWLYLSSPCRELLVLKLTALAGSSASTISQRHAKVKPYDLISIHAFALNQGWLCILFTSCTFVMRKTKPLNG